MKNREEKQLKLYLVRHAEPKRREEDPERSLTEKGWSDIRRVAAFLSKHEGIHVKSIIHSGKARARQTAEALAEHLKPGNGIREMKGLKPLDEISFWVDELGATEEETMLVGHLPYLSTLSSYLLCHEEDCRIIDFKSGSVACLERNENGDWSLQWMVGPEVVP